MADFMGKVVILTGASGGFGRVMAEAFVAAGLRVAAIDVNGDGVAEMQRHYGADRVLGLRCDISDADDCLANVDAAVKHFGAVHMLVNNGALGMNSVRHDAEAGHLQIEDCPADLWTRFFQVNVNGPFFMSKAVVPILRRAGWGRVINITTSFVTMLRAGFSPYGPTKAAVEAWSLMLARELEGSGITVNVVVPGGPADTPMVLGEDRSKLISPKVMIAPMLWLMGEAAAGTTGQRIIGVEWDPQGDPEANPRASIGWPNLVRSANRAKAWS
jgi:NAD(P)-dependent dehydrogenase (short-subunit alcohol dehydrogenase family)